MPSGLHKSATPQRCPSSSPSKSPSTASNAFGASLIILSLPNRDYGDLALLNSVLAEFSQYGKCFGVVRRNVNPKTGMVRPYVILQYTVSCSNSLFPLMKL